MKIYIKTTSDTLSADLDFDSVLDNFYVAYMKIVNEKLVIYASSHKGWSDVYVNCYQNDPIVFGLRPVNNQLSMSAWGANTFHQAKIEFLKQRFQVTHVDFGITAYRQLSSTCFPLISEKKHLNARTPLEDDSSTLAKGNSTGYEFFALGIDESKNHLRPNILNCQFIQSSIENIVNVFSSHLS